MLREGAGANRPLNGAQVAPAPYIQNVFTVPFSVSYEADLFGSVRHGVEAANATLQSTAADLQNAQLVLTAELAADYFSLRESDAEYQVVEELVGYESKGMELVNDRHNGGIASGLEVAQQAALLDATRSQLALVRQSRAQYEHAIAALLGTPAPSFAVAAAPLTATPPPVPLGVPSDVLERRPDIASYERQIAYANAQIGIATAAFYPHITLGGAGGWQSRDIATLANAPSLFWSLGADALQPLFEGGRNRANLAAARSAYDASVADYRQSVLTAFQQVEDGISNLQTLEQAATTQAAAVEDARRELAIANNRYVGGVATYLDVITAQSTLLDQRTAGGAAAGPAHGQLGVSGEGAGRRMAGQRFEYAAGSSPRRSALPAIGAEGYNPTRFRSREDNPDAKTRPADAGSCCSWIRQPGLRRRCAATPRPCRPMWFAPTRSWTASSSKATACSTPT